MNIPNKAIDAAAKYLAYLVAGDPYPADAILFGAKAGSDDVDHARELVQHIAPLIVAQALRNLADDEGAFYLSTWLRDRASEMENK